MHTILLGLTTTPNSDWRAKIEEIKKFNLKEIALFPTCLEIEERKELYNLLEKTSIERIPHVHLRHDFEKWELDLLSNKYDTQLFNIHASTEALHLLEHKKYRSQIYVENLYEVNDLFFEVLDKCGGLCLDASHFEDYAYVQKLPHYEDLKKCIDKYKIGCCHVSAVSEPFEMFREPDGTDRKIFSHHVVKHLTDLDYVQKYVQYLPKFISIELENSFEEQLKAKDYLEKIITTS